MKCIRDLYSLFSVVLFKANDLKQNKCNLEENTMILAVGCYAKQNKIVKCFIGEVKRGKPSTCRKSLTNFII